MRKAYIVSYDISDPRRLRLIYKTMRSWGDHLQLSVFRCELSSRELVDLRTEVGEIIHHKEDQVLFVDIGPVEGRSRRAFSTLGRPYLQSERHAIVV